MTQRALGLRILPGLLLSASALSQSISTRIDLAGDALVGAAAGDQSSLDAARGASSTLVVWADRRGSLSTNTGWTFSAESELDIYATRLDAGGAPLENVPIPISLDGGDQLLPRVAWNGSSWLVTWVSEVPTSGWYTHALHGVRVSAAGAVLDAQPIEILQLASSDITSSRLTSNGSDWLAVVQGSSVTGLWGARVSAAGVPLDASPVLLDPQTSLVPGLSLTGAQGVYMLVWSDWTTAGGWEIFGRRYGSSLQALDATPITIGATAMNDVFPSASSDGSRFLVAWERYVTSTGQADVRAARVATDGTLLDSTPIAVSGNLPYGNQMGTSATWDGSQWYVSWSYAGIHIARIASNGSVLDFGGFALQGQQQSMQQSLLSGAAGGGTLVTWVDDRAGSYEGLDLYGRYVLDASTQGGEQLVTRGAPAQLDLDLASGGMGYLAVYGSETSGDRRILAARLDPLGQPLDAQPIVIAQGIAEQAPAVAWDGSEFLIVWEHSTSLQSASSVWGRRMAPDGSLLGAPFVILNGTMPEVAALAGNFLVVASQVQSNPQLRWPVGVRVRGSDGAVLGTPFVLNSNYAQAPDVAVLGNRWAMVWQQNQSHDNPWASVQGTFVEADGTPSTAFFVGDPSSSYNYTPRIASSGGQALIVWTGHPPTSLARKVYARRLLPDGSFADSQGFAIAGGAPRQRFAPAVAWSGNEYVVVFQDQRNVSYWLTDSRSDVFAARVTSTGAVLDPLGFPIEQASAPETRPAIVGAGGGLCLMGSSVFRPASGAASFRIGLRRVSGDCPPAVSYCTALMTSHGCLPALASTGTASLANPSGFVITASNLEPGQFGLMFFGTTGRANVPFFGGTRCVATPLLRLGVKNSGGSQACSGSLSYSLSEMLAHPGGGAVLQPGVVVDCQMWFRDPQATFAVGLTDGLEFTVCP